MSDYQVIWHKSWQDRPIFAPDKCTHSNEFGSEVLSINQRLDPTARGPSKIRLDGSFCMNCGTEIEGRFTVAEALRLCMDQHGWNREVGLRLHDLAAAHEDELMQSPAIPIWCLHAFGWSGRAIVDALNSGKLNPARMSEEVESLSAKVDWQNVYDRSAAA